ncbi:MAG: ATP-binding protein [Rhodocyclaceae bacterium]|nr:ATP-binding protein [Rhodocyclaceae bacterium]MCA3146148.1 ATP-binding protein [Rhodocyclaceae bacterium]
MTDPAELAGALAQPFAALSRNPATHFRLWFYAAIARVMGRMVENGGSFDQAFEDFPFLAHYANQLADHGLAGVPAPEAAAHWDGAVRAWENAHDGHLPLRALREALDLGGDEMALLMTVGLPEEDARFGALFEQLNGTRGLRRPTVGLLAAWWAGDADVHEAIRHLSGSGLLAPVSQEAPRAEWQLAVPPLLWDAMRGLAAERPAPWARFQSADGLQTLDALLLDGSLRQKAKGIAALLAADAIQSVVVRGPRANGRRTLLGALARATGRGLLEIDASAPQTDERWRFAAPLATLLGAMPVLVLRPGPGETAVVPDLPGLAGPLGITMERQGGLSGAPVRQAVQLELPMPGPEERREHWQAALGTRPCTDLGAIAGAMRLGRGSIRRAADLAATRATLDGREAVTLEDVRAAACSLHREALETIATPVSGAGDWSHLAAPVHTLADLHELEVRCRHRESLGRLAGGPPGAVNAGVRALFKGPSGTGKTLAARLLANALGKDIYRIDLAAVVNKYIGETEKNLERAFSRAEELDVMLLLDEGDALLAQRTDVDSSNDRYANLETNYLLQRVESFGGILLVTTNAGDRIDGAFARRMDVVVDFPLPQPDERLAIWSLHLPAAHAVDDGLLWDVAQRCALSGGQIRNAALHATLLALDRDSPLGDEDLLAAIRREYRKAGGVCPLRQDS